jgi:hypothetical protein
VNSLESTSFNGLMLHDIKNVIVDRLKSYKKPCKYFNKGNAKRDVSPHLQIRPRDLDLWPRKTIGFQILLRSKHVPSLVKIHWRMLILDCSQGCYGRTNSSVTISHHNFVGDILQWILTKLGTYLVLKRISNPIDFQGHVKGQGHRVKFFTA